MIYNSIFEHQYHKEFGVNNIKDRLKYLKSKAKKLNLNLYNLLVVIIWQTVL